MSDSKVFLYRTFKVARITATTRPAESILCTHVTLMRLSVTTVTVEKQYVLHILSVCLQPQLSSMQGA